MKDLAGIYARYMIGLWFSSSEECSSPFWKQHGQEADRMANTTSSIVGNVLLTFPG